MSAATLQKYEKCDEHRIIIQALYEVCHDKEQEIIRLQVEIKLNGETTQKLYQREEKLLEELRIKKSDIKRLDADLKAATSTGKYQKTLRRQKDLEQREVSVLNSERTVFRNLKNAKIGQLKNQVKSIQTVISNNKIRNEVKAEQLSNMMYEVKLLKERVVDLEAEISLIQDQTKMDTKDGQRYNSISAMCVMELAGELDVPSGKVSKVIRFFGGKIFR